jgi:predicted DNA-binding protein with PD1-like motif
MQIWPASASRIVYRRFQPGESLVTDLESFALGEGITEAAITSCIGSLRQLKLRNLCRHDESGSSEFQRTTIDENLELVSAEGYIQPMPEGGIRVHIHVAAARPSGEMVGGHCEDATTFTGAFMYLQVME